MHKLANAGLIFGLGLLCLLSLQTLESGHFHNTVLQSADCLQCQVGSPAAALAEDPLFDFGLLIAVTFAVAAPRPAIARAARPVARGPPAFS